jgi:hypothetical protein
VSINGFGFNHDGQIGGMIAQITDGSFPFFQNNPTVEQPLEAFELCFDTGTAPAVGYSRTLTSASVASSPAQSDWSTLQSQASVGNIDLIANGTIHGQVTGLLYLTATNNYQDRHHWFGSVHAGATDHLHSERRHVDDHGGATGIRSAHGAGHESGRSAERGCAEAGGGQAEVIGRGPVGQTIGLRRLPAARRLADHRKRWSAPHGGPRKTMVLPHLADHGKRWSAPPGRPRKTMVCPTWQTTENDGLPHQLADHRKRWSAPPIGRPRKTMVCPTNWQITENW